LFTNGGSDGLLPGQVVKLLEGVTNEGKVLLVPDIRSVVVLVCFWHLCQLVHREVAGVSDGAQFRDKGRFLIKEIKKGKERQELKNVVPSGKIKNGRSCCRYRCTQIVPVDATEEGVSLDLVNSICPQTLFRFTQPPSNQILGFW